MKKISFFLLSFFLVSGMFTSCDKEKFTEDDAYNKEKEVSELQDSLKIKYLLLQDSLRKLGGIMEYTVKIYSAGGTGALKATAADDVKGLIVSVAQNGMIKRDTLKSDGLATFEDMRVGTVAVSVKGANFTEVSYVADITPRKDGSTLPLIDYDGSYYDVTRYAATMVPVFPLTGNTLATVKGRVTYEKDLTNDDPEILVGAQVIATIDVKDSEFRKRFLRMDLGGNNGVNGNNNVVYAGTIVEMAYGDIVSTGLTDANGNYEIKVPSTADGLAYTLQVGDFVDNQTLFMNTKFNRPLAVEFAKQTIRTVYSFDHNASLIPAVPTVFVSFSAPEGPIDFQPTAQATAIANMKPSGIKSIHVSSPGYGYTQVPTVEVTPGANVLMPKTTPTVVAQKDESGRITGINVTAAGEGYLNDKTYNVKLITNTIDAVATARVAYSINPKGTYNTNLKKYTIATASKGSGYDPLDPPTVKIETNAALATGGVQATATANIVAYVDNTKNLITDGGNGYVAANDVDVVLDNKKLGTEYTDANFSVVLDNIGQLDTIKFTGTPLFNEKTATFALTTNYVDNGKGTTITPVWNDDEVIIANITATSTLVYPSNDPTRLPTIYVTGGGGSGCKVDASWNGFGIDIVLSNPGSGYKTPPTVEIVDHPLNTKTSGTITFNVDVDYKLKYFNVSTRGIWDRTKGNPTITPTPAPTSGNFGVVTFDVESPIKEIKLTAGLTWDFIDVNDLDITIKDNTRRGKEAKAKAILDYGVGSITINEEGKGYYNDNRLPKVTIKEPKDINKTQATFNLTSGNLYKGYLADIEISNPGEGYVGNPHVIVTNTEINTSVGDKPGKVTATATNGKLAFTIPTGEAGEGYESSTIGLTIKTYLTAAAAVATVYPEAGQIESFTVTNPGEGYTKAPTVVIFPLDQNGMKIETNQQLTESFGKGATGTAVMSDNGRVNSITLVTPGSGYYRAPAVELVIPSDKITATGRASIDPVTGSITGVTITNVGAGYTSAPTVTFKALNGVGKDAAGKVFLNTTGTVNKVALTNKGSGYISRNFSLYGANAINQTGNPTNIGGVNPFVRTGTGSGSNNGANPGSTLYIKSGFTVVGDVYMGTGKREIED